MAYLMTDMAAGSSAALQLQQNMAAAPNVQETEQLKMQEARLKVQADQQVVERNRLNTMLEQAKYTADENSRQAVAKMVQSPEFKQADDVKRLGMLVATEMEAGNVDKAASLTQAMYLADARRLANEQKVLDQHAQTLGNADAVLSTLKTPEQVEQFFNNMPEGQRKAIEAEVGPTAWSKLTPEQKRDSVHNLMLNAKGQLASRKAEWDKDRQETINKSRENVAEITAKARIAAKNGGGKSGRSASADEIKSLARFEAMVREDFVENKGEAKRLDDEVARTTQEYNSAGSWFSNKSGKEAAMKAAIERREQFNIDAVHRQETYAKRLPEGPAKERILHEIELQKTALGLNEKPEPKPTPSREASGKVGGGSDTSNTKKGSYSPEQESWITKAMSANPGMTRDEVVAEGKKRGKL